MTESPYQELPGGGVLRRADGAHIPPDPQNRDWQTFLEWGGTPDPAPEPGPDPADGLRASALAKIEAAAGLTEEERNALFGTGPSSV